MKKTILTFVALAATSIVNAQVDAGTIMLGGDFGINSIGKRTDKTVAPAPIGTTITESDGHMNWSLSPTVGFFVADEFAVGIRLGLSSDFIMRATSGTASENIRSFGLGASLFGRKYFEVGDNLFLFGEVSLGFSRSSYTMRGPGTEPNKLVDGSKEIESMFFFNIAPGLAFFPSENWGIDFTLNRFISYTNFSDKSVSPDNAGESSSKQGLFNIGAGLRPTLGIHYYISR